VFRGGLMLNLLSSRWRGSAFSQNCIVCIFWLPVLGSLIACASTESASTAPVKVASVSPGALSSGFFVPSDFFKKNSENVGQKFGAAGLEKNANIPPGKTSRLVPEVLLYASATTAKYFSWGGVDAKVNIRVWETFLRKYKIPYRIVESADQLELAIPGVLLLPSTVSLSDQEKRAVISFREKGGSVLASWLSGVRNESGAWLGFAFMKDVLGTDVMGNTEGEENDNFLMVNGDNPVTHYLPAGQRIWLERAKGWYPLRLSGGHPAANIMDWSRTFSPGKPTTSIVFDERPSVSGYLSRSVVLGYPERLWLSADPKMVEAIAHNALMWLLRQPSVYVSAWPYPFSSAFVMAVETVDFVTDVDNSFAKMMEDAGGRATFYLLSDVASKSAPLLKKIQARGHEVAYFGDRFESFLKQSEAVQAKRLDDMRKAIKDAGLNIAADAGFRAPMDTYDKITEKIVKERDFGHFVTFMHATDARLPFVIPKNAEAAKLNKSLIGLPSTQMGPEQWMDEGEPEEGLLTFLDELTLSEQMSGLSLVRVPNQSLMSKEQLELVFSHLKTRRERMWLATAGQVTKWWQDREQVNVRLVASTAAPPHLTVTITGEKAVQQAAAVWVNLPQRGSVLRLVGTGKNQKMPRIANVDVWRAALVFEGWVPGEYEWDLYFDSPSTSSIN
jgi:hypothetical protein